MQRRGIIAFVSVFSIINPSPKATKQFIKEVLMPPTLVVILVLLIIFAWFVIGDEKSMGEKATTLIIFLIVYLAYRMLNGATAKEALFDPLMRFLHKQ